MRRRQKVRALIKNEKKSDTKEKRRCQESFSAGAERVWGKEDGDGRRKSLTKRGKKGKLVYFRENAEAVQLGREKR